MTHNDNDRSSEASLNASQGTFSDDAIARFIEQACNADGMPFDPETTLDFFFGLDGSSVSEAVIAARRALTRNQVRTYFIIDIHLI